MTSAILLRKIAKIGDKLSRLQVIGPRSFDEFVGDRSVRDLSAFYLALAIEDCIDLAEHVISQRGYGAPASSGESFRILAQHGVLSTQLADQMAAAAGMRNAILHEYDDIDWFRVHSAISDLSRIRQFVAAMNAEG